MKAIILAAGCGRRMYPLAQDKPKCLLSIGGEVVLERQVRILCNCGISDISIVVGYYGDMIKEIYQDRVWIYHNPFYYQTGSAFSLWLAQESLLGDCIILNADTIFSEKPIDALMANKDDYCLVVDDKVVLDDEAQKVKIAGNNIIEVNKKVPINESFGESIGITKVQNNGISVFKDFMTKRINEDITTNSPTIFHKIAKNNIDVNFVMIEDPWIEIDTPGDYYRALELFANKDAVSG